MKSSVIKNIEWLEGVLHVTFLNGKVYTYADVPKQTYDDFAVCESPGKFFSESIRGKFVEGKLLVSQQPETSANPAVNSNDLVDYLEWTEEEEAAFLSILDGFTDSPE